jgi:citrate lyase subunit alpha/citrate CoA-transferase
VLRSHGGRWQAIQDGELHLDIAVIAAPTADTFGNATGDRGPTACGLLGFALADSLYADHVIVVTDNLVPFPCIPWQIQGNNVDQVVVLDRIGDASKIVSGTTEITKSPDRLLIAELTARFCDEAGIVRDGFSFQAGAGGTALSFALFLRDIMRERGIKARFVRGGSTQYLVDMLEEGLTDYILDGQTFDLAGVRSMRENPGHVNTSPFTSYNWHGKGNFASLLDAVVLGATEVDVDFNANVVTHSDGRLLHGIGGWMNCLAGRCTILPVPQLPGPHPGAGRPGDDPLRPRRADRRRGHRAGHRRQPPAAGPVGQAAGFQPAPARHPRPQGRGRGDRRRAARPRRSWARRSWPRSSGWTGPSSTPSGK